MLSHEKTFNNFPLNICTENCEEFFKDFQSLKEILRKDFLPEEVRDKVRVFAKNPDRIPKFQITSNQFEHAFIVIGQGHSDRLKIRLNGSKHFIYLSDNSKWNSVKGKIVLNDNASLIVGKGVSSFDLEANISGSGCIIGDDVMFAQNVKIRTHSGHGFVNTDGSDFYTVEKPLLIEPHVWIGEHVKIFNTSYIGSCSVVAYGSLVVKDIPRMRIAKGYPAVSCNIDKVWVRSQKPRDILKALKYHEKFIC